MPKRFPWLELLTAAAAGALLTVGMAWAVPRRACMGVNYEHGQQALLVHVGPLYYTHILPTPLTYASLELLPFGFPSDWTPIEAAYYSPLLDKHAPSFSCSPDADGQFNKLAILNDLGDALNANSKYFTRLERDRLTPEARQELLRNALEIARQSGGNRLHTYLYQVQSVLDNTRGVIGPEQLPGIDLALTEEYF